MTRIKYYADIPQVVYDPALNKYVYDYNREEVPDDVLKAYKVHWHKLSKWKINGHRKNIEWVYDGIDGKELRKSDEPRKYPFAKRIMIRKRPHR
jgi:hypothetical protein